MHTYTDDDHTACKNSTGSGGGTKGQSSRNAAPMARLLLFTTNLANQMLTPRTANLELGMEIEGGKGGIFVRVFVRVCDWGVLTKAAGVIQCGSAC